MKSIIRSLMVLSIICMSVSCLRLQHIKTYGDIYNYEYLGMDFSSVVPDPNAEARDEIVFPDDIAENKFIIHGVRHHDYQSIPSNTSLSSLTLGSKSISFKVWSPVGVPIHSTFQFFGEKLYSLKSH